MTRFKKKHKRDECFSHDTIAMLKDLIENPCKEALSRVERSMEFRDDFEKYDKFKSKVLNGTHGKMFWARYMDIIQMTLTPIRAAKENDIDWNIAALYALRPMFFAYYHSTTHDMYSCT